MISYAFIIWLKVVSHDDNNINNDKDDDDDDDNFEPNST